MARSIKGLRELVITSRLNINEDYNRDFEKLSSQDSGFGSAKSEKTSLKYTKKQTESSPHLPDLKPSNKNYKSPANNTNNNLHDKNNPGTASNNNKEAPLKHKVFPPSQTDLDELLSHLDMVVVTGWLEESNSKLAGLCRWMSVEDNFCHFCHHWLSGLEDIDSSRTLKIQVDIIMEEIKSAFTSWNQPVNSSVFTTILHDYIDQSILYQSSSNCLPSSYSQQNRDFSHEIHNKNHQPYKTHDTPNNKTNLHSNTNNNTHLHNKTHLHSNTNNNTHLHNKTHLCNNTNAHNIINNTNNNSHLLHLLALTSQDRTESRMVLSDLKCSTRVREHIQGLLALRAHSLVSIWSGIVETFKNTQKSKKLKIGIGGLKKKGNKRNDDGLNDKIKNDIVGMAIKKEDENDKIKVNGDKDGDKEGDKDGVGDDDDEKKLKDTGESNDEHNKEDGYDDDDEEDDSDDDDNDDDKGGKDRRKKDEGERDVDRMMQAIRLNQTSVVSFLLHTGKVSLHHTDPSSKNFMFHSVLFDRPSVLQCLIMKAEERGIEVARGLINQPAGSGNTALHACVNTHNEECLKVLLSSPSTNPNQPNPISGNSTPLHLAIMHNKIKLVKMLLDAGADGQKGMDGMSMQEMTAAFKSSAEIRALLKMPQ